MARAVAPQAELVTLTRNTGGAGGFAAGLAHSLVHEPSWIWLMDDDTIPSPTALEQLLAAVEKVPGVAVAGSRVVWTDGSDHPMNTPRRRPFAGRSERAHAASAEVIPVRSSSFVSMLVDADAVMAEGLPIVDYFIWNDDFEYSTRLLRRRVGVYVPGSVVVHKTKQLGSTDADPGERFYFEVRNKLWMLRLSRSLSPAEKLLYGASTLRRWWRTFQGSSDRGTLSRAARRGWRDGWRTRPRSNADALADQPGTAELISQASAAGRN
jgi:GT2 family glycosyltransferase